MGYQEFIKQFTSGDILLFSSNGCFASLIKCCSMSKFSHIGLVLCVSGKWVLLESGYESINKKLGVQLTPMEEIYQECEVGATRVYVRRNATRVDFTNQALNIYNMLKNCPYDMHIIDWIAVTLKQHDIKILVKNRKDSFWCSALVAFVLRECCIIASDTDWTLVAPNEFAANSVKSPIRFNVIYSDEEYVSIKN